MHNERSCRWQHIIKQVEADYRLLPVSEKAWIAQQLQQLATVQQRLQQLFEAGNGKQACRDCLGECCAKGHNHMTLANLLGFMQRGEQPPEPSFSQTCPFLGEQGCVLEVADRPYNCITFVCDIIENSLTSLQVTEFYALERQLRSLYQGFAERYAGAGLTGLLLQSERLNGQAFLDLKIPGVTGPVARQQELE